MNRARYEQYLAAFNGKDYARLGEFYADDVLFVLSEERGLVFEGRDAILGLYREFHQAVEERVAIVTFADGGDTEANLMFAGHAAFRFKQDPFYSNNFTPTVKQLVDRILTGD